MHELELKFALSDDAAASLRAALLQRGAQASRLRAHYLDTPDGRLSACRVALRLREDDGAWTQTLKAAGDSPVQRLEHEVPVAGARGEIPACDITRHAGTPAGDALAAALHGADPTTLVVRHGTDVTRLRHVLTDASGTELELALDEGAAVAGPQRTPIAELEIEYRGGPVRGLFDLARAWLPLGGLWLCTIAKSARGERLWHPDEPVPPVKAATPALSRHADGAALLRAIAHAALDQVLGNASEIAEGRDDQERIHQLRVGLRRLRTVLRELAGFGGAIDPAWEQTLAETFGALGVRRDAEVVADAVEPLLRAAHAPLLRWTAPAAVDVAAVVRASGFQLTLVDVLGWLHGNDATVSALGPADARKLIAQRLQRLHRRITRAAARFNELPPQEQHRERKRLKRLRYLAESVQSLWDDEDARRYLAHFKPAQDALGHHNDVATAASAFRAEAERDPRAWFAAGFLQAHLAVTARDAHRSLREIAHASPFWRR